MTQYLWIRVKTTNHSRVLLKLFKNQIEVLEVKYGEDVLEFKILAHDYKKLKKIVGYRFFKVSSTGVTGFYQNLKKHTLIYLGIVLFVVFIFLFSRVMISVQVIHSNKEIRELVQNSLENYGIKRLTFKKDFKEIEEIKKQILNDYPEQLEWIEIEVSGMKYIVRIEERIITKPEEKKERCHLVATKSAIVKKMIFSFGDAKVFVNDFVREGDILVSGELIANETLKGNVCATGDVYGEVWYTAQVSLPLTYEEKRETGKNRWNLSFAKGDVEQFVFRSRLTNYVTEKKHLFTLFGVEIYFVRQKEVEIVTHTYTEEEALNKALSLVDEKFQMKLLDHEEIVQKKVLKKQVNNSTMDIEVFVSLIEHISRQEEFQGELEEGY